MKKVYLLALCIVLFGSCATAQLTTRVVKDSLFIPWEMVYGPDDNIWFTQKNGYICKLQPSTGKLDTLYHETATVIQNEGGMLGLALHPQFPSQPYVFVAYNYMDASVYKERIVKYEYASSTNTLQNPQVLLDNINATNIHNGCRLLVIDNYLYITTGDASTTSNAQSLASLNGKILRINLDGSIPADNPISGSAVWSWGHRNAQGIVYANNKLYETEHGPNNDDEINIIQKGRNYGWPTVQGFCNTSAEMTFCNDSNVVEPLQAWTPTLAVCGVDYYDHPMFSNFQKSLIMCTLKDSKLYQLKLNGTLDGIASVNVISGVSFGRLRDICISPSGKIYISTSNSSADGSGKKIDKIIELYDPSFNSVSSINGDNGISIYPNPSDDILNILVKPLYKVARYSIVNNTGQLIASGALNTGSNTIAMAGLVPGVYHVTVRDENTVLLQHRVVKH